jgi:hypothetical protein
MSRKLFHLALILLVGSALRLASGGEVVDRIVATVNGHPILQSDWDEATAYETFADGRSPGSATLDQRKAALDRLIDQELVREQIENGDFQHASSDDVERRVQEIRKVHAEASDPDRWRAALQRYGLSESELREKVAVELEEMRAIDAHLRPGVQIDSRSVESYYHEKLLPELRQSGAVEVPLEQVAPKIRELLAQQRINDLLANWIRTLRSESDIRTPSVSGGRSGGGGR